MDFTIYYPGGAKQNVSFNNEGIPEDKQIKHPDKKKGSLWKLAQEWASDAGGSLKPFVEERKERRNKQEEIKKAKAAHRAYMLMQNPQHKNKKFVQFQQPLVLQWLSSIKISA